MKQHDDIPTPEQLRRRASERAKLIIARIIKSGDPTKALKEAQAFLVDQRKLDGGGDVLAEDQ